jgi:SRSO17 transposase
MIGVEKIGEIRRAYFEQHRCIKEIVLAEIDRVTAAGVHFGCLLADAGYGLSAPFRQGLTARNLAWAVGIPRHLKVYPVDVRLIWPVAKRGRPRRRSIPDILSVPAEDMLADAKWQTVSWRTGTKGKLKARFAAVRVGTADGPPQRIRDKGQQHLPSDEAWLIGEHRASGEKKYQACRPSVTPSSRSSLNCRRGDAHTAENGSA